MATKSIFSVCGMCTVRCPIQVDLDGDDLKFIQGNPHSPLKGALCARGAAGPGLLKDSDRIRHPLIREGERGEGKWRKVTWDEAFDYVAERLQAITQEYGAKSILWSDRSGPFADLHKAFVKGMGSVNYCNHDVTCGRNVHHAAQSLMGLGRKGTVYDYKNAKHVILQTRNIFEAINVKEVNDLLDGMAAGTKLTVIDIRATITAGKADRFFQIRPGTDYAFNLAVINELINKNLYDSEYVKKYVDGFDKLKSFVSDYTPEWAEEKTGARARDIRAFVAELGKAAPGVIWHPGWMSARYDDSFYVARTAYIINALLGSIGTKGGLPLLAKPGDCDRKGLNSLAGQFPKPEDKRADGVGWKYPHLDAGPGLLNLAFKAIETGDPYPVKAYIVHRHDPMMALPDPEAMKKIFANLDLMVSITFSWSTTAWNSDVVLPMSPYLERESIMACKNGLKPFFFVRKRAMEPSLDTKADWEILTGIAKKMGIDKLAFDSIEDIWKFQLEGTGVSPEDFDATGMVGLTDKPIYFDRDNLKFKTPSGKIEIISAKWEENGIPSLKPYEDKPVPEEGKFRIAFGRCGVHTQGHTMNNPILHEQMPENVVWINKDKAQELGIQNGDTVVVSGTNGYSGKTRAFVTEFIHPEAAFMVHGFNSGVPAETRAREKGVADHRLMVGGLEKWSKAGGGLSLQEHFVTIEKV
ncbi:molybdopterin-dependent oxidoreductase [Desulfonatronovibrio hydrogenovorans]|uniref:molybdopterin-dependent oxidoreductase n=1 Tax=Desulfonatronovibrio hydrogenovorans TaxID=53245 RepID=UPI00048F672D|nr:molybdopterin-dependent oxidoreductase [Desulfonatronovibrio hydrogenovorans]